MDVAIDVVNGVFRVCACHPFPNKAVHMDELLVFFGVVIDLPISAVKTTKRAHPRPAAAEQLAS